VNWPPHPLKPSLTDRSFSIDAVTFPPAGALLFKGLWCYLPERILPFLAYLPVKQLRVFRRYMGVARKVASKLLDEASQDICVANSNKKDVMSLMGVYLSAKLFHEASRGISSSEFWPRPQAENEQR
jgi:hypothetical protein